MRRFRSLAAYQIHCSPNTGEFEARVQIQFGLLDLELLTKWMSATLLSQAADGSPRFLHTTSSFNHCWVPVSWIVCVSTAATHPRCKTRKENCGSAETSASNGVYSEQNNVNNSTVYRYYQNKSNTHFYILYIQKVLARIITKHSSRLSRGPDSFTVQSREKTPWWGRTALCCCCSPPTELRRQDY